MQIEKYSPASCLYIIKLIKTYKNSTSFISNISQKSIISIITEGGHCCYQQCGFAEQFSHHSQVICWTKIWCKIVCLCTRKYSINYIFEMLFEEVCHFNWFHTAWQISFGVGAVFADNEVKTTNTGNSGVSSCSWFCHYLLVYVHNWDLFVFLCLCPAVPVLGHICAKNVW